MRILRDYQFVNSQDRGASVAIGNFDGVHRGHQAVLDLARRDDAPLGVVTFEPHPRAYFAPESPSFRLMSSEARASRLAKLGVTHLYELPFNTALSALTPEGFAQDVLMTGLGVSHVVVGADFCFGKGRAGTAEDLKRFGDAFEFDVTIAPLLQDSSAVVSSTAIRKALSNGQPQVAHDLLGHWHRIEGEVVGGEQRGRTLGYPTANMNLDGLHLPAFGVYAVLVDVQDGAHQGSYLGAASLGVRPQFDGDIPNLETYLFDFSGDLYGATLSVGLVKYLRPEMTFDSLEAFVAQMDADCVNARQILSGL